MKKTRKYLIEKMEKMYRSTSRGPHRKPDYAEWEVIKVTDHGYHPYFRGGHTTYYRNRENPEICAVIVCDMFWDARDRWLYTSGAADDVRLAVKYVNHRHR